MCSNAFFTMRAVISKITMEGSSESNVSASRNNTDSGMNNKGGNNYNAMDVEKIVTVQKNTTKCLKS